MQQAPVKRSKGILKPKKIGDWKKRGEYKLKHVLLVEERFEATIKWRKAPKLRGLRVVKVYLVPRRKKQLGDTILVIFPRYYCAFLDHVDVEPLSNGEVWYTLHYDCMDVRFVEKFGRDMTHPDFPWDRIAQDASSCVIEVSIERGLLGLINQSALRDQAKAGLEKPIQGILSVGSWWILGERMSPGPNTLLALKHQPFWGSTDPTSIVSRGVESPTVIGDLLFPPRPVLETLVPISHPGELADRYPGR